MADKEDVVTSEQRGSVTLEAGRHYRTATVVAVAPERALLTQDVGPAVPRDLAYGLEPDGRSIWVRRGDAREPYVFPFVLWEFEP